jgi:hypothetical protein
MKSSLIALSIFGLAMAPAVAEPGLGWAGSNAAPVIPLVAQGQDQAAVVEAHLYLNFAPTWLKTLGRSAESAEYGRGTRHFDVGAIRRRDDNMYALTLFHVGNGVDSVMQGLEQSCMASGGRTADEGAPGTDQIVYCLVPAT